MEIKDPAHKISSTDLSSGEQSTQNQYLSQSIDAHGQILLQVTTSESCLVKKLKY